MEEAVIQGRLEQPKQDALDLTDEIRCTPLFSKLEQFLL